MLMSRRLFLLEALAVPALGGGVLAQSAQTSPASPTLLQAKPSGFNGQTPGPILRVRKGDNLHARLINQLDQPTSIHWRGIRGPNAMDGVAGLTQNPVVAGASFDYSFTPPDSGTFIYQAHAEPFADRQISDGLSGLLIVEDDAAGKFGIDVPLPLGETIPDKSVGKSNEAVFTIKGRAAPVREQFESGSRLRLRLAKISPASITALTFTGVQPQIIAIDGQPCPILEPANRTILIAPGARFDVVCDMPKQRGKSISVHATRWPEPGEKPTAAALLWSAKSSGVAGSPLAAVSPLPANPLLPERIRLQDAKRASIVIGHRHTKAAGTTDGWTINGTSAQSFLRRPLLKVRRNAIVVLTIKNETKWPQVMWLHGHCMRILHRFDDGWQPYWRDTIIVPPSDLVRVAFIADNPGKWRLGSGILARSEIGLKTWIEVD